VTGDKMMNGQIITILQNDVINNPQCMRELREAFPREITVQYTGSNASIAIRGDNPYLVAQVGNKISELHERETEIVKKQRAQAIENEYRPAIYVREIKSLIRPVQLG
jgi:hypothetical protein